MQEPEQRPQEYMVGNRSVSRSELQSVLMMFQYILVTVLSPNRKAGLMLNEVERIQQSVQYANGIYEWDWLEGIGESYVPDHDTPDVSERNKSLCPKRWWPELPPCPLGIV